MLYVTRNRSGNRRSASDTRFMTFDASVIMTTETNLDACFTSSPVSSAMCIERIIEEEDDDLLL